MAEALLRARLEDRDPGVTIGSAGLYFDGRPAERHAVSAMARRNIDLSVFRARKLSAELLASSSLILTMEHLHVREITVMDPSLFPITHTLPEFVVDAAIVGPRGTESLAAWAARIGELRTSENYLSAAPDGEVPDPMGRSARSFRACADQLDVLIAQLVDLAWPGSLAAPDHSRSLPIGGTP